MSDANTKYRLWLSWLVVPALAGFILFSTSGCPDGAGNGNENGGDQGMIAGTVTNSTTGSGVSGVAITLDPEVEGVEITTAEDGAYSADVPADNYTLTFGHNNFESQTEAVSVILGETTTVDVALTPTSAVVVSASVEGDAVPGATLTATATVETLDGSTVESYSWAQSDSVTVTIGGADTDTATVTLPGTSTYKDELFTLLVEPAISGDDLPPNIELPEGEFPGGLQDRFQVVGLNPFALEETALVALEVTVTTTSGTYTGEVEIHTELPWKVSPGIRNVPTGLAVLLHGKTQDAHDWALTTPSGSSATLADATSQNPYFTPDSSGVYTLTVTDSTADPAADVTLEIYAGTWEGAISGQDADGRPVASACTVCHKDGGMAADQFTPWAQTGHADIFSVNMDTSTHYSEGCFDCHTVGFNSDVDNGGIDEASDYEDFLAAGLFNNPGDNWTTVLSDYPETAQLANIQCENCHGPQNGGAHMTGDSRTSISSDVCATCHGEPLRHARFQQWQLSGHANYELAIDEHDSSSCARCHTGNGFLAWAAVEPAFDPETEVTVAWTADETHPQTCVTCHDPHSIGTSTGVETDATMRIYDDTPELIAGFSVTGAGNGAICMTCHNSRRGLRNDSTFEETLASGDAARAPHGSTQTDVLMGQNAYFDVNVGTAGSHALLIEDTCVNCHMESTPPPDLLSYDSGGTNHTFSASVDICAECHSFGAEAVQPGIESSLEELQGLMEDALLQLITDQIAAGNTIDLDNDGVADIIDAEDIDSVEFGESRGRQAITVTFSDATVSGPHRMSGVRVLDSTETDLGELYDFADDDVIKAGWNWNLINNDGSLGVHNPTFAGAVLDAAIAALNALAS